MLNLYKEKLIEIENLKKYTKEILEISKKKDDRKIMSMTKERQCRMETINLINSNIERFKSMGYIENDETEEIKVINMKINECIKDIIIMDKEIRKNITAELINVKRKLNKPEKVSKLINVKF